MVWSHKNVGGYCEFSWYGTIPMVEPRIMVLVVAIDITLHLSIVPPSPRSGNGGWTNWNHSTFISRSWVVSVPWWWYLRYTIGTQSTNFVNNDQIDSKIRLAPSPISPPRWLVEIMSWCSGYDGTICVSESTNFKSVALLLHVERAFELITTGLLDESYSYLADGWYN